MTKKGKSQAVKRQHNPYFMTQVRTEKKHDSLSCSRSILIHTLIFTEYATEYNCIIVQFFFSIKILLTMGLCISIDTRGRQTS